ncbi:unnamed protein product [Arctia plantaginis]|uniref:C2H2-type domain-containing protein n=1 Tax=Arctia plantaginis TaxID=874455 RepID=A0A8S1BCG0_ARCPL|nr:unnamed protein product [Arctia plantaginis]
MTPISATLNSLINGKRDVCCLCLNAIHEQPIRLTDDIIINMNTKECDKTVEEVLKSIFDEGMHNYITTFNTVCGQCTKLALSFYKFKQTCLINAEYFTNILDAVANSMEYTTNEFSDSKSLFVSLNIEDFTSKHYYDMKRAPCTRKSALKRFHSLDTNTLTCEECHKEFHTVWSLRNHCLRVHAPKKFKCHECPRSYGSAAFLESHINESHCTVVCSECGKTFYNRHTLKMHELGHHLILVCQDCGRVYKNKATFKKHIDHNVCEQKTRANPSEAKFTCDYCNKKYTQKMSLRVHIQYEHGNYKPHICEWCGKKFCSQSRLKAHTVKHTKERNFPCTICGGKFVSKESLLYHTRTHTGEKPYKCPHCEYRFLSASRRSDHVKRHHLGGNLECDICHSKFRSRSYLFRHKKTHMISNDKLNLTYGGPKSNTPKASCTDQSISLLTKNNVKQETSSTNHIWKIDKRGVDIPSFQNVIEATDVQITNFVNATYEEHNTEHSDDKVYLEMSEETEDLMKLAGIGT